MIQHPPESMHPSQRPGGHRRGGQEPPAQTWRSSPYGRDRDYEPDPARMPYAKDQGDPRRAYWRDNRQGNESSGRDMQGGAMPRNPEWHQDQQYARQDYYDPPPQFPDWQESMDWPRGPGYRSQDMSREQAREMDEYYAERYANPENIYDQKQRPPAPSYRGGNYAPPNEDRYASGGARPAQQRGQRPAPHDEDNRNGRGHAARASEPAPTVNYRGRAPKGYVRSDERIREDICDRLSEDALVDASDISVSVSHGIVTLDGLIADRPQKHRAEDIADACSGVKDIRNHLSVPARGNGNGGTRNGHNGHKEAPKKL